MAKKSDPCKITLNRKDGSKPQTFTYGEFMNMLYDGGIDDFVKQGLVDTNALSGNYPFSERQQRFAPKKEQQIKGREWVKKLKEDPTISDDIKRSFNLDTESYITLPNSLTVEEANNLIDIMGIDEAYNHLVNMNGKNMPSAYRAVMSQIVLKKLNQMGDNERAVDIVAASSGLSTDLAQGLQAFSLWKRLTPEGQLLATQRDLFEQRRNMIKMYKSTIQKITNSFNKIQRDTAKEVADKFKGNSGAKPSIPSKPPTNKQYGADNKNVTRDKYEAAREALLKKLNGNAGQPSQREESVPDEVFTIAAFHYEASKGNMEAFTKALIEDLGPSMEQYADMLFELSKIEIEEAAKAKRIDELTEKLNKLIAPPKTKAETEEGGQEGKRKTKAEQIAEIASELDALTGTTDYTQMAEMYKQAKEVKTLTDAIDRMTEDKEPETKERKTKEERLREAAARLDEINGGTFYSEYVEGYIEQKKVNDLSDKLDEMMSQPTSSGPTPPVQKTSRNDKMRQMAAEVDAINGNTDYSDMVEEYIEERELQELEGKFNKAIQIKPPKPRTAPASRQKRINQMALDLQAKTGDSSYVAAAMAFEKAKKDQADAKKKAREQQAAIKRAASEKGILTALSAMGTSMSDIIRSHYSGVEATKERLIERLINEAGVSGQAATNLADKISQEFDKLATERKQKAINTMLKRKAMLATPKKKKSEIDIFIERSNMGMLTEAQSSENVADIMGFPGKISASDAAKIKELADKVQEATSEREKERAMYDLMKYRISMNDFSWADSIQSIWMASILSGHRTQATNIIANSINSAFLYGNALSRNPLGILPITKGLLVGLKRGFFEGLDTWRTGKSPLRGQQIEIPDTLETHPFKGGKMNPFNYYKYVRRFMIAADTFSYEGLKQMRAHQLAYIEALERKDDFPNMSARKIANKLLNRSDTALKAAITQAETERDEKINAAKEQLSQGKLTPQQYKSIEKFARADERFRIHEILEESRDQELMSAAHKYAARGTYNHPPEGYLGVWAKGLNQSILAKTKFTRYFIPFVNIITNVTNETLNYSPIGAVRAFKQSGTVLPNKDIREMDSNERTDLYIKAAWGTVLSAALMYLSGDDDEEPTVEITANGFGSPKENGILEKSGWQPNSFRVKNPFTGEYTGWFSYRYTPMYFMMSFIGGARDQVKYKGQEPGEADWAKWGVGLAVAAKSMFESTYLNSLEDFMELIHGSTTSPENFIDRFLDWFAKTGAGFLPNLYTQAAQAIEDWMEIPAKEIRETYLGRILRDIPVARDRYFNRVGVFGDDLPPDTDIIYSVKEASDSDDIANMMVKRHVSITTPSRTGEFVDINREKVPMDHDQFYNFMKIRGHFIKYFFHNDQYSLMSQWEAMTDEEFKQEVGDIELVASIAAKEYCDKYIPMGTKDYWKYVTENYPLESFTTFKMVPKENVPLGFNLAETLAEIGMKHLIFSNKEMGKELSGEIIENIEKSRERSMYEPMLDTLPAAEQAVVRGILARQKSDSTKAQSPAPPTAPLSTKPKAPATTAPQTPTGAERKFRAKGKVYTIKDSQVKSFLKSFPDAEEINE